jgi:uncharacterized protein (TIGR03067 family)
MVRKSILVLVAMLLPIAVNVAGAADDSKDLEGTWQGTSGADGFKEIWTIKAEKDGWSVNGVFKKDGKEVGAFSGKDVKLSGGTLSFAQTYSKKPNPTWADGTLITAKVSDGKLAVTWQNGKQKGTNTLERGEAVASDKDPPKKPDDDKKLSAEAKKELEQLAGNWEFKSFLFDGKKIDFGATWTFKDGTVDESIGGNSRRSGPVTVDPGKTPKEIDINFNKGPDGGAAKGLFKGIYEIKDNTLTICIGSDQVRPTELESKEGSKALLMVFERKKK